MLERKVWSAVHTEHDARTHYDVYNLVGHPRSVPMSDPSVRKQGLMRSVFERFWAKTIRKNDCFVWTGSTSRGYGMFTVKINGRHKGVRAHRFLYESVFGKLPRNIEVLHSCDVPGCVALQHLSAGTHKVNMLEAAERGRMARGTRQAKAKLTAKDVRNIRRRHAAGEYQTEIAKSYKVTSVAISMIITGKTWRHVR